MYHHSSYSSNHHHHHGNVIGSAATATTAVVISQKKWNGTAWVEDTAAATNNNNNNNNNNAAPPLPDNLDLPAAPPHMQDLDPKIATPSQLVTQYSHYYQYWSTQANEFRQQLLQLGNNNNQQQQQNNNDPQQVEEINRRAVWAEYYADRSSRAAHYYLNLPAQPPLTTTPTTTSKQQHHLDTNAKSVAPKVTRKSRWGAKQQQQQQQQHQQQQSPYESQNVNETTISKEEEKELPPPASLQRFAHANLSSCQTKEEKELMQQQLEVIIRTSIQDGTMHTKDWDLEPKISIPSSQNIINNNSNNNDNYNKKRSYANIVATNNNNQDTTTSSKKKTKSYQKNYQNFKNSKNFNDNYNEQLPTNDSYYGNTNSSSSAVTNNTDENYYQDPSTGVEQDYISLANSSQNNSPSSNMCYNKSSTSKHRGGNYQQSFKSNNTKSVHKQYKRQTSSKSNNNVEENGLDTSFSTLAKRADRFKGKGGGILSSSLSKNSTSSLHDPYSKNVGKYMGKSVIGGSKKKTELDYEQMTVKGTCQILEKKYLRLTAPPRSDLVRPQPILQQHLTNLKTKYYNNFNNNNEYIHGKEQSSKTINNNNDSSSIEGYNWFCSQFKALRQDLTVQRIFNAFTVEVYETHARIALEQGDLNEYNQCQTQLKELYELLLQKQNTNNSNKAKRSKVEVCCEGLKHQNEFIAYRLIYHVFLTGNKKYEGGSSDLFKIMLDLTPEQKQDPAIVHALKVRSAFADFDYHAFFKLKETCPNLGGHLMEYMVPQVRFFALQRILKSYRPTIAVSFVLTELGLNNSNRYNIQNDANNEGIVWLQSNGIKVCPDGRMILCKESSLQESQVQNSLI